METVEAARFIRARPGAVERLLAPETILEYEGTFRVVDVDEADEGTVVTARAGGGMLTARFVFETRDRGFVYRQDGRSGPFEAMETRLTVAPKDEGSQVTMRSSVSLAVPLPFADRIAAWKRRGELDRALDRLAADAE